MQYLDQRFALCYTGQMNLPELLLPVGNYQMCLAAIHNGADAIYVGMPGFNARGRAYDHEWSELEEIIQTCHLYSVRVHLAFNILIFEDELFAALEALDRAVQLGVDAFIVQDIGLIFLMRKRYPNIVIHGSTQMSVTNHEAIELLDDLNIKRFVLGRENSLDEIKKIKENTNRELEVFVHGALCVAYSGQCFTSEAIGGRSANRGQCAQSCRFDYELFVDGQKRELVGQKYLLSPQDLCGVNEVAALKRIGVNSFKVEGRLKSPEYVASTATIYKKALQSHTSITTQELSELAVSYSRGFYSGWLNGVAHQELVLAKYNANRGQFLTKIKMTGAKDLFIQTKVGLKAGDGLLFVYKDKGKYVEFGDKIYHHEKIDSFYKIGMGPKFNGKLLQNKEVEIYLTRSEDLIKKVKKSITDKNLLKKISIDLYAYAKVNQPLILKAVSADICVSVQSECVLENATGNLLDLKQFGKKLISLGHTVYECKNLELHVCSSVFIPNKEFKQLKQKLITLLNEKRLQRDICAMEHSDLHKSIKNQLIKSPKLNLLFRKIEQVDDLIAVLAINHKSLKDYIEFIILDFEFGKDYFTGIQKLKENQLPCAIATNRILKPNEYHHFKTIERCAPDAILIRNLGALNYFKNRDFVLMGDFSLNCANSHTFEYLSKKGLSSQTASYDLNIDQLNSLISHIDHANDPIKLEITIHQYMPEFHMEHCVFAAFLSKGNSFKDCGKPCEKHEVFLKDMYGYRHEIKADQECRNTMFKSEAQSSLKYLRNWNRQGVTLFRFECLHEVGEILQAKLLTYLRFVATDISPDEAFLKLGGLEYYGLGLGQLEKKDSYKDRKKT